MRFLLVILLAFPVFAEPGDAFSMSSAFKRNDIIIFNQFFLWDNVPIVFGNDEDFWMDFDTGNSALEVRDADDGNLLTQLTVTGGAYGAFTITEQLEVGIQGTKRGVIYALGDNDIAGGRIIMKNAANENGTTLFFQLEANGLYVQLGTNNDSLLFAFYEDGTQINDGTMTATQFNSGEGFTEIFGMNQDMKTTDDVVFNTVDTGEGANDLFDMNQNVLTTSDVVFNTINTGHGVNELYQMDQDVQTTNSPIFTNLTLGLGAADVDYTLTFDGEDSDGTITWLEGPAIFSFDNKITIVDPFGAVLTMKTERTTGSSNALIAFKADNTTPTEVTMSEIAATIEDFTASSEDSSIDFSTMVDGTFATRFSIEGAEVIVADILTVGGDATFAGDVGVGVTATLGRVQALTNSGAAAAFLGGANNNAEGLPGIYSLRISNARNEGPGMGWNSAFLGINIEGDTTATTNLPVMAGDSGAQDGAAAISFHPQDGAIDFWTINGAVATDLLELKMSLDDSGLNVFDDAGVTGDLDVLGVTTLGDDLTIDEGHFESKQVTPPGIVPGDALGGVAQAAVLVGTDSAGLLDMHSGNSPDTGIICTVTFNTTYTTAPISVIITPASTAASIANVYISSVTATTFVVSAAAPSLLDDTDYDFYYWVVK